MYTATTHNIKVTVFPIYLDGQSIPDDFHYVWAYTIQVENQSADTVQLISRHWIITDANGQKEEVRGPGVVGEQPILQPGQAFQYTSGASLKTSSGIMHGTYEMMSNRGERMDITIPMFSLDSTEQIRRPN